MSTKTALRAIVLLAVFMTGACQPPNPPPDGEPQPTTDPRKAGEPGTASAAQSRQILPPA